MELASLSARLCTCLSVYDRQTSRQSIYLSVCADIYVFIYISVDVSNVHVFVDRHDIV